MAQNTDPEGTGWRPEISPHEPEPEYGCVVNEASNHPEESRPGLKAKVPRLYHKKSRNGCHRCRTRRVKGSLHGLRHSYDKKSSVPANISKCDENLPVCSNCRRHGVICVYDRKGQDICNPLYQGSCPSEPPSIIRNLEQQLPGSAFESTGQYAVPNSLNEQHRDHLELRLLHNFVVDTTNTLPATHIPVVRACWSVEVPQMAFSYQPLLDQIFAISALHLSRKNPDDPRLPGSQAYYSQQALRGYREMLARLTKGTEEAACFTSILVLVKSFASLEDRCIAPYTPPVEWMEMAKGSRAVFEAALEMIENDETSKIFVIVRSNSSITSADIFDERNRKPFSHLSPGTDAEDIEPDTAEAYEKAVRYIGSIYHAIQDGEHPSLTCRRLMIFPLIIPPRFIELVKEMDPRALVLLAHFFAVSAPLKDTWWIGQAIRREVLAIKDILRGEWMDMISWPVGEVIHHSTSGSTQANPNRSRDASTRSVSKRYLRSPLLPRLPHTN